MAKHSSLHRKRLAVQDAEAIAREKFGRDGMATRLPGWEEQNFRLDCEDGTSFVLKVSPPNRDLDSIQLQNAALEWLEERAPDLTLPRIVPTSEGAPVASLSSNGSSRSARLLTFVPGVPLSRHAESDNRLLGEVGGYIGRLDAALAEFDHPGTRRVHLWDLAAAPVVIQDHVSMIPTPTRARLIRRLVARYAPQFSAGIEGARTAVIHNDVNDHNVLIDASTTPAHVAGLIDFGDLLESKLVFEVAIAATYGMLDREDPVASAAAIVQGYHRIYPLVEQEIELLHACVLMRLCTSVCLSATRSWDEPEDPYLTVSEAPAWRLLERLESVSPHGFTQAMFEACAMRHAPSSDVDDVEIERLREQREEHVSPVLSLAYERPIHVVRGSMQYLYDANGREYLDTVNNVCHVGHSHPRVVEAAQEQIATLNTNTRYLYRSLGEYAERLCALFPDPLNVCYLVCSGSEANDLALRLARAHTRNHDVIVLEGAYHGALSSLIDMSPYKHDGPGGTGAPDWVQVASLPDTYRGAYRDCATAGTQYAEDVGRCIDILGERDRGPAAFFVESLPSCAGQIVFPPAYLSEAFTAVRAAGGLCVADEVQVGFGRVGITFWGFELQGVIPDIVTLGKPIGNGHPLAAVVTTAEIAASFDNGMEYFNTFGGNPVSCAIGSAVLDVIAQEGLQINALDVGTHFKTALEQLTSLHPTVGNVRGEGLFLGVELVTDRDSQEPATHQAQHVVETMKERGILASRDGRFGNVLKIKPPLCFTNDNAERYVSELDSALTYRSP